MVSVNFRNRADGRTYAYLVKRRKVPTSEEGERLSWYLGPVNQETLEGLIEVVSEFRVRLSREQPGSRVRCPVCDTPVSKMGLEDLVAKSLYERLDEMREKDEDVFKAEEYAILNRVADSLARR